MRPEENESWNNRWVVLPSAFFILFMEMGVLKSYGVLLDHLTRDLGSSARMIGLSVGLCHGLAAVLAIINPPLLRRFSFRQLIMAGSFCGSLCYILSAFSQNGFQFFTAQIAMGLSWGIVLFPTQSCPARYFHHKFAVASSIILSGGGVGMMILSIVTERFVQIYGWRGAMAIVGALSLHCLVCGALIKPIRQISTLASQGSRRDTIRSDCDTDLSADGAADQSHFISQRVERGLKLDDEKLDDESRARQKREQDHNLCCFPGIRSVILELKRHNPLVFIKNIIDFRLIFDYPRLISVVLTFAITAFTYGGWIVFLIPNAIAKGFASSEAVLLATVGGVANILGRFIIGLISSTNIMSDEWWFCLLQSIAAVAFFVNNFASSFYALAVLSLANGFCCGAKTVMINLITKNTVPDAKIVGALSLVFVGIGLFEPMGGAFIGLIFDVTRSYNLAFTVCGAIDATSVLILLIPWLCARWPDHGSGSQSAGALGGSYVQMDLIRPETKLVVLEGTNIDSG